MTTRMSDYPHEREAYIRRLHEVEAERDALRAALTEVLDTYGSYEAIAARVVARRLLGGPQ